MASTAVILQPVVRKKHFGSQTEQCPLSLAAKKAENVDQSDSSVPLAATSEDTPALGNDGLHLTPFPSNLRQPSSPASTRDEDLRESCVWRIDTVTDSAADLPAKVRRVRLSKRTPLGKEASRSADCATFTNFNSE
jgi:hypothetical protein